MSQDDRFREQNDRISEMFTQTTTGDISGLFANVREQTQIERDDTLIWAFIVILGMRALAELIRRSTEGLKPIIEVAAEKYRESGEGPPKP